MMLFKHCFSRYIQPGATQMESSVTFDLDGVTFVAFLNPDGTRIIIISNKSQVFYNLFIYRPSK